MNQIKAYQIESAKTLIPLDAQLTELQARYCNFAMGLVDESIEMLEYVTSLVNIENHKQAFSLEMGDWLWCAAQLCNLASLDLSEIVEQGKQPVQMVSINLDIQRLVVASGQVVGYTKKAIFHKKGVNESEASRLLAQCFKYYHSVAEKAGLAMDDIARDNKTKLTERYPELIAQEHRFDESRPNDWQIIEARFPNGEWIRVCYHNSGIDGAVEDTEGNYTEIEEHGHEMLWRLDSVAVD